MIDIVNLHKISIKLILYLKKMESAFEEGYDTEEEIGPFWSATHHEGEQDPEETLELGGGISLRSSLAQDNVVEFFLLFRFIGGALAQDHVVEFFLFFGFIGGNELGKIGLGLLHAVATSCL